MERNLDAKKKYPKLHPNTITEIESINALRSFLPAEKLLLRTENRDYGIDLSLEVVDDSLVKNYRAQVQMKGTNSLDPNADGTYSLSVETSNVNYLLNSPISLYFLFIKPSNEIRYVWTWDERRRLESENPDWINQDTIVLRFDRTLNDSAVDEIHRRIQAQGKSLRTINEHVFLADSDRVVIEMNPETYDVSDLAEIRSLLEMKGTHLSILGFSDWVLEKLSLFSEDKRKDTPLRLAEATAYLEKGHYQRAKECISMLRSQNPTIAAKHQTLSDYVKLICDMQTSVINFNDFVRELGKLVEKQTEPLPYDLKGHHGQVELLLIDDDASRYSGSLEKERWERHAMIRQNVEETAAGFTDQHTITRRNRFAIFKSESQLISLDQQTEIGAALLRLQGSRDYTEINGIVAKQIADLKLFNSRVDQLSTEETDPVLSADLTSFKVANFLQLWITYSFLSKFVPNSVVFLSAFIGGLEKSLNGAILAYDKQQHLSQRLNAQISLAGLYFITGRNEEYKKLQESIIREAEDFNLKAILNEARNPPYVQVTKIVGREPVPDEHAELTEKAISAYAQQQIDALGLPIERLENIKIGLRVSRDRAKEHRNWCPFFDLVEFHFQHVSSPNYYRLNPKKVVNCSKYGHVSNIERLDWQLVMAEFKKKYCSKCPELKSEKMN